MDQANVVRSLHYRKLVDLAEWQGQSEEEVIEPELPIVDAHHHLWDGPSYGNQNDRGRYLLHEFLDDVSSGHRITGTVHIQTRAMYKADGPEHLRSVGETEFVNGIAAMTASGAYGSTRVAAAIVGYEDLARGDAVDEVLELHMIRGGGRFRGIRQIAAWDPSSVGKIFTHNTAPGLLLDPEFRRGFARLAKYNLTFDTYVFFTQLDDLADLARSFPDSTIIVDHAGGPLGIGPYAGRPDVFEAWKNAIRRLAEFPNVVVKLGGLGMLFMGFDFHLRGIPPTSKELAFAWRPYLENCIELIGTNRCMFESNFPVDKQSGSYAATWNAFKRIAEACSQDEKAELFSGTASRVYRLS